MDLLGLLYYLHGNNVGKPKVARPEIVYSFFHSQGPEEEFRGIRG